MTGLRVAWRNIWRNPRRTGITVAAVALNAAVLVTTFALVEGFESQMLRNVTHLAVGEAQVHATGYLEDRSMYTSIPDPSTLLEAAAAAGIKAAPRSYGYGLVSRETKSAGAMFWGVDPAAERNAFNLPEKLTAGEFLDSQADMSVVLGRKLARSLHAEIGAELVMVVQAADGSMGNELFTVRGILSAISDDVDRAAVIMHRDDFRALFESGGRVHEIAMTSGGRIMPVEIGPALGAIPTSVEIKGWRQLMPMFSDLMNLNAASTWLFALIFFLAAGLGVMNTMLMATHDRIREFGVLKAIGATPMRIVGQVIAEAWMLALVSTTIGGAMGVGAALYFQVHPIDLSASGDISFAGMAFDPLWRADLMVSQTVEALIAMWGVCIVASLYPAIKAALLDPVVAMTHV